jgi:transcription elongation GreA/GreB family factor
MSLFAEATELIERQSFDEIESRWMARLESGSIDLDEFLNTAKMLRKAGERSRADALLELLADTLKDRQQWPERFRVLRELARLSKKPDALRAPLEEALRNTYGSRPSFQKVMDFTRFAEKDPRTSPGEKAEKVENWLAFDEGEVFFMAGRGAGVVTELNPELGICRLDFEDDKRVSVPLGAAQKFLTPLPPGHLLRQKIDAPEALRSAARENPSETFARLLQDFGRPLTMSEVRDAMTGVVSDDRWSGWWAAARKNPQIVVAGSGAKAAYAWNASADQAEQAVKRDFDQASVRSKLDLARRHSARSKELADYFASQLAEKAKAVAASDPALAWETFAILEKLPGKYSSEIDPKSFLKGPLASRVVAGISDRALRERAIRDLREFHPDWQKVYAEIFFLEEDPRTLSMVMSGLEESGAREIRDRLIDETLRYPRRHPKAFYWYLRQLSELPTLVPRANYTLLFQMLEATSGEEFGPLRARIKEFFDQGGLGIRIVMQSPNEEQAQKLLEVIERYGSLEEYRREFLRGAILMTHPRLREPQAEPIFASAEALAAKREEHDRLKNVELPAVLKAIKEAREMGDLTENFEYKAARQRQEYVSARVANLQAEIARVRVIEPAQVDTSEVRVGTKITLSNGDVRRQVTILGPWESSPEHGVYSHQSDIARALMGKKPGELVSFLGNDYLIEAIEAFRQ